MDENKSCWSRRTKNEKLLTVSFVITFLVAIGLLVGLIVVAVSKEESSSDVCLTSACIQESSYVLKNMNLEADPCDDFYEFACGSFLNDTVIPDDKTTVSSFSLIDVQLRQQLRVIVSEQIEENEIEAFKNVKKLYSSCMNTELIESRGATPVLNDLTAMGRWPVLEVNWNSPNWEWVGAIALSQLHGYSVNYLLSFGVSTDNKDSTKRVIRIDQAALGLSREYLIQGRNHPFVQAYQNYQVDLAVLFGADRTQAQSEMNDVLDFEFKLAEISTRREDRRNATALYNLRTIAQVQIDYPYIDWLSFINSLLPTEVALESTDEIIVAQLSFFEKLGPLLEETNPKVLANYIKWRQAVSTIDTLPSRFRDRQQEYVRLTTGKETSDPRWMTCVDISLSYFPHAFGALYVRKHFNEDAKAKALEMVINIKNEFKEILKNIDWMDETTKTAANTKADKMGEQIGFADELMDDEKITEYYDTFEATINENEFYESIFGWNVASRMRSNKKLKEPIDKTDWTSQVTPAIVNAFYSSLENMIKFPAGILQGAFFNAERPQYMNYGGIGFVIGHEITHGFDDQGSQYDGDGNLQNWWQPQTEKAFGERAECIINQYGNYTEPLTGLKLNGINTQGENIADNGGVKESYLAYVRWAKNNRERKMPGLDYSPQQMFWISAGQIWCSVYRKEAMNVRVTAGVHSPGQFRVIGPMSNSKEFAKDFNCAVGTKMNPESKCEVW